MIRHDALLYKFAGGCIHQGDTAAAPVRLLLQSPQHPERQQGRLRGRQCPGRAAQPRTAGNPQDVQPMAHHTTGTVAIMLLSCLAVSHVIMRFTATQALLCYRQSARLGLSSLFTQPDGLWG